MTIAKALAVSAVAGMLAGSMVACGGGAAAQPGATEPPTGGKSSTPDTAPSAAPAATGSGKSGCSAAPAPKP
jgi:hypothetical protein